MRSASSESGCPGASGCCGWSGCGGGDGGGKGDAGNVESKGKSRGTASVRAIDPAAQARAESMALVLSDLPDGWRGSPSEDEDDGDAKFRRCIGSDYSDFT